ncbi:conserved Plasmodium protein, unknown function [Plasmodium chabaudi adami]|uniref:Uncharacterized protein n=1 Tax=Plasmodium chabaudi adami TaxID=5826 RepID=A0A1D3RRF1_PLACE|nr:conserved Plasmodium protein, unknown function [Plasmodium chabaudi adami]
MERDFHDVNSQNEDIRKSDYNGNDQMEINNLYMNSNMNSCSVLENMKYNQNVFNENDINLYKYNLMLKRNNMHIHDSRKNINNIITPNNNSSSNSGLVNDEFYNNVSRYNMLNLNNTSFMQNTKQLNNTTHCHNDINNMKNACLNKNLYENCDTQNNMQFCNYTKNINAENKYSYHSLNSDNPLFQLQMDSYVDETDNSNCENSNGSKQLVRNMNTHSNLTHVREREIMNSTCNNNLVKTHEEKFLNSSQSVLNNKINISQTNHKINNDNITNKIHFINNFNIDNKSLNENIANNNYSNNSTAHGVKSQGDQGMQNYMDIHEDQYISNNGVYGNNNDQLNSNLFNHNLYLPNIQISNNNNNKAEINGKNNKHDNKISELNTTSNKYESLIRIGIKHMIGNKNSAELKNNTNLNKINLSASSALCSSINGNKNNIKFPKCVNEKNDYIVISPNNNNIRNITNNNNFENIKNIPNIVDTGDINNTSNIDESEYLNNTEAIGSIEANPLAHKKKANNNNVPLNIYINSDSNNITKDIDNSSNSSNENIIGAKHPLPNIIDNLADNPNVNNTNKINFTNVNSLSTLNVFNNNNSQRSFSNSSNSSHSNNSIQIAECENTKGDLNNNKNINNNVCTNKIVNNANTNNNIESFDSNSFPYAKYIINNSCTMKNIGHNNNSNCNGTNFNKNGMYIENRNINDTDSKLYNNVNHFHNNLNIHNSQNLRKIDNTISRNSNDNNNYIHTYNNFSNNGNNIYNNINSNNNGYLKQKNKEIIINHQNDRTNLNNDVFINLDNSTNTSLSNSAPFGTILNTHLNHRQNNSNKINPDILINKGVNPNHISNVINNGNQNNPNYMTKGLRNGNNNNVLINDVTNVNSKQNGNHVNNFMNGLPNNNGFNLYNNIDMGVNKNTENNNGSIGNINKMFSTHTNMNNDLKNTMNNLNDNNKGMPIKPSVTNFPSINQTPNNYNTKKYVYPSNINPNMDGYSPKLAEYSLKNDNTKDRSLTDGNMINVMRRVGINDHYMNKNMVHNLANNGNEIENMPTNLSNNMTNNLQLINNNISMNRSSDINKYKNELLNNLNDFSNRNDGDHLILNREHPEMFNDGSNKIFYKDIINNNMNINMNNKSMANCNNNGMVNYMDNSSVNRTNINGNGKTGGSISIDNNGNHIPINNLQNNVGLNGNYDLLKIRNISNDDNKLNSIDVKNNLNNLTNIDNFQNKIQLRQRTHGCSENGGPNNNVRNNSTGMNNRNTGNLNGVLNIGNINYNKFYDATQQNSRIQKNNNRQNNPNINGIPNNGNSMNEPSNIYSSVNHLNGNINRSNLNEVSNNNKIHSLNNNVAKQAFDGLILMRNKCASNDIKYSQNGYEIGNGINRIGHTSSNGSNKIGKYELNLKNKGTLSRSNTIELPAVFNKNEYLHHPQNNNNKYPDMYNNNIENVKNQLINSNNSGFVKNGINNGNEYQMANNINKNNLFKVDNVNRINNKEFNNPANANNINNYSDVRKNSYQIVNDNSGGFNENEKGSSSNYMFEHNEYKERNRNSMYNIETEKLIKNENVNNRRGSDYINNNFSSAYNAMIENYNRNNLAKHEFNKIVNMISKGDLNNSLNLKNLVNINKNFNILMNNLDPQNGGNYVNHDTKENCNINIGDNNNNKFYNGNNHKIYVQDNNKKTIQPNNINIYNENNIVDINLLNKNNKKNNMIAENMNANNISLDNIGFKLRMQKNGYINNDNNISGISDMTNFDNPDNLMYILNRNNNILMKNGKAGYINSQLNNDGVLGLNNRMNFNTIHNNMTNINNHNVDHLILNNNTQGQNNNDQMLKFSMNQNFQEIKNGCIKIGNKRKQMEPLKTIDLANIDEHQFLNNGKKNARKKKKESVNTSSGSSGNDVLLPTSQNKILGKIPQNMFPKNNTARLSTDLNNNMMQNMNYSELDTNQSPYMTPDGNILSNWGTTPKQITKQGPINSEADLLSSNIKDNIQTVDINYVIHNNVVGNANSNAFTGNHISMNGNLKNNNNNNIIYKENGSGNSQNNASNTKDMNTMMMGSTNEFYHKIKTSDNGVIPRKTDQFQLSSFSANMKWNEIENIQKGYQQDPSFPNTKISEHSVTDSTSSDYKNEEHELKEKQVQKSLEYIDKHIANYENLITNLAFINDKENKEMKKENDQIYNGLMNSIVANLNAENLTEEKNSIESSTTTICKNINELFDNKDKNEKIHNKSNGDTSMCNSPDNALTQNDNKTENVMENTSLKDTQNEINKINNNNSNDFSDNYEEKEFEDNMNKHVFFKNKKQYETFIMFNEINVGKDNINLFMSMNISSYNKNSREQNEAYNLYLENEEGKEMHGDQIENINISNILDENCHNVDKYDATNEDININENEMIKNNMLRSLLSINSKEEIKKIIENKIFGKNNENKKIVFSVVKQIDDAKFLYILKVILKEQNISCNKNKIKVLKIQKRKILYKTFYQKSNKSKALTLEYILKADQDDIGEMNCLVRSEECLLEGDREKRNIEKIINANFEITTTTVSMATPTIVNLFKNDYVLQNSYYCDFWSFYLCLNDQFNATIEFHQNKNKANGNKAYKLNIRAHCENYEAFFENFIEFLV